MSATAITWADLIYTSQQTGALPVVLPTGSAALAGMFRPLPQYELQFGIAVLSHDVRLRCRAITAALMSARAQQGLDW